MKNDRHRSHDPGKYLRGHGEAKAEGFELIHLSICNKPEVTTAVGMDRNLQVRILEVDGEHAVVPPHRLEDRLVGLHLDQRKLDEAVEGQQIYHRPPRARCLPHYEQTAVITWRGGASSTAPLEIKDRTSPWRAFPLMEDGE